MAEQSLRARVADLLHLLQFAKIETPSAGDAAQAEVAMKEIERMLDSAPAAPAPAIRMCPTMQRPEAECGCPDCGSSLVEWPAPAAQEPVAWVCTARKQGVTEQRSLWSGEQGADIWLSHFIDRGCEVTKTPLYTAPPAAEQPYSTTSDRYRAELYDEVWEKARLIGFGNVTDALAELQRMKLAEQPDTVRVPVETLQHIHRDLDACQKVIWLAGCHPCGYGFDPAYVSAAQDRLKEIDALLGQETRHA